MKPLPTDTPVVASPPARPARSVWSRWPAVLAGLLALNLVVMLGGVSLVPQAQADNRVNPPFNATAQRKAIQEELSKLRGDVQSLRDVLTSGKVRVNVDMPDAD